VRDTRSRGRAGLGDLIDRRSFLGSVFASLATFFISASPVARAATPVSAKLQTTLRDSTYVYVSPLRPKGEESSCHGEVWYSWIDGSVVLITSKESWKARSLRKGRDRARVWVGNYGRWKGFLGRNEDFRKGPSFEARASESRDKKLLDQMLESYEIKYPEEIADWRDKMRSGFEDETRVLIRYTPV
jgi:hypothetical protein